MITGRRRLRRFGQNLECGRQQIRVTLGLIKSPLSAREFPNAFQVALGGRGKPYSAMRAAELALERASVEALWLAALFTLDQCRANRLDLRRRALALAE